jgi:maltooligosyltrehalose synthase
LKFTCPGVPDVYQGTEFWDFSLVDPDNRRPVNYEERQQLLEELAAQANETHENLMHHLWKNRYSAKIKLWLVHKLLNERKAKL